MVSNISGAGLGLFLLENAKKGERIAVYSGEELNKIQANKSDSKYLLEVSKNVILDARGCRHCDGKYINCGSKTRLTINARFSSCTSYNFNKELNLKWISIFATCDIQASKSECVEILVNYGTKYWGKFIRQSHTKVIPISNVVYKL